MIQAMYSGIAGMKAFKGALDVIGNNIANINTTAYKGGRANFKDMLSQTIKGATAPSAGMGGSNSTQVGLGVILGSIDISTAQGSMQATGRNTDLAVEGNGFFALGGGDRVAYTRDGSFVLDAEFNLVQSGSGLRVLGWAADLANGTVDTSVPINAQSSMRIPVGGLSVARPTTKVDVAGNLDASSVGPAQTKSIILAGNMDETTGPEGTTFARITGSFDRNALAAKGTTFARITGSFDSGAVVGATHDVDFIVYDQAGVSHDVKATFTKDAAPNTWTYALTGTGVDVASLPPAGSVTFDAITGASNGTLSIPMNLTWNAGADSITAAIDTSVMTEGISTNASVTAANKDGNDFSAGSIRSVNFTVYDQAGVAHDVTATFTKDTVANTWNYVLTATGADVASLPPAGSVTFDPASGVSNLPSIPLNLTWNLGVDSITAALDTSVMTEGVSTNAVVTADDIDGYAPGAPVTITKNIYDSLGYAHPVTVTFTKQPIADTWRYTIACPDATPASIPTDANFTFTGGVSDLAGIPMSLVLNTSNGSVQPMNMTIDTEDLKLDDAATIAAFPATMAPDGSAPGDPVPIRFDVYDSLGITHEMKVIFMKTANPASWDYEVVCPDAAAASLPPPGQITFNNLGYSQLPNIPYSLVWATPNGSTQPLIGSINTGSISQLNGATTVDLTYQDGLELGTLESYTIGRDGSITGVFTNGSNRPLGQMALAQFNNPAGVTKVGNNVVNESPNSGAAKIGKPGDGGLGMINAGFLESSNVDLATEFAAMIVAQRGFQATSKIITTSDEILQELVSLKR
ncbi:MAG: flagellar hook-basal body complex protein [Armatimonadetes bacterium]|nr:flagellar hook-basal body complex protein [Armatimonadota bacterium]